MKPAGLFLLFPAGMAVVALADDPATGLLSAEVKARIREGLPAYQPPAPAPEAGSEALEAAQTGDPNVLVLPKLTVKESRLPPGAAEHLMSKRDLKRKMENLYLDTLAEDGPLNVLLNNFTIPFLSPTKAQRGRAIQVQRELDRLHHVTETRRAVDPAAAREFRRELDNSHTTRPAGTK